MVTYNFLETQEAASESSNSAVVYEGKFRDTRNGIICINPTADIQCYCNYIQLLNLHRDKWKTYGYLDLGMMPIVMGPSFMHHQLLKAFSPIIGRGKIPCHNMPPVSLMHDVCKLPDYDVWAFKEDVADVTGIAADKLTLELLLRWCMK